MMVATISIVARQPVAFHPAQGKLHHLYVLIFTEK
jgi:hypothetical protein